MLTLKQLAILRRAPAATGNRLREARQLAGKTQVEVAAAIGITQGALSDIERRPNVMLATAQRLARYYGCTVEDLFPFRPVKRRGAASA